MTQNLLLEPQDAVEHMLHGGHCQSAGNHDLYDRWCLASSPHRTARLKKGGEPDAEGQARPQA